MRINHATQCISRPTSPFRDDDQRAEEKNSIDDPKPYPTQTLANAQKRQTKVIPSVRQGAMPHRLLAIDERL